MADPVNFSPDDRRPRRAGRRRDAGDRSGASASASKSRRSAITKGLSLQAACRMCLVEVEKMPKLLAACTLPVGRRHGGAHRIPSRCASPQVHAGISADQSSARLPGVRQGRRVRTAGHGLPLRRGRKPLHRRKRSTSDEKQWSPVVFFDAPRCILCFRCVRVCNEGMGVGALGVVNRGVVSRDRAQSRRPSGVRRVRHVHRHLPGRRAHQRHLSLSRRARGRWSTSAPSARTARTAARPRSACATTTSCAATIATAPASTASSCASRAATLSISRTSGAHQAARWFDAERNFSRFLGRSGRRRRRRSLNRCTTPAEKMPSDLSGRTALPTKKIICSSAWRGRPLAPTTSIITAPWTTPAW